MKRALFAAAVAASWCSLLLWAADVDWRSPLGPAVQRTFYGSDFRAVFGSATARDSRLHVEAAAADFSALQSTRPAGVEARDFQVLRYRFADFPRTLELSLVFRTAEHPDDVFIHEAAHDRFTIDMDTPEDYARILERLASRERC